MWVTCETCHREYDDAKCWTICPHGPIEWPLTDYCPKCDTVKSLHGLCRHQLEERANKVMAPEEWTVERAWAYVALLASLFGRLFLYIITEPFKALWRKR
jgi:hypothetical protein